MSKKMLRRSLALGALMAFVITGSAMAAEIVNDQIESAGRNTALGYTDGTLTIAENEVVTLENKRTDSTFRNYGVALADDNSSLTVTGAAGSTLNIVAEVDADGKRAYGIRNLSNSGMLEIDVSTVNVTANAKKGDAAVSAIGIANYGKEITILAEETKVNVNGSDKLVLAVTNEFDDGINQINPTLTIHNLNATAITNEGTATENIGDPSYTFVKGVNTTYGTTNLVGNTTIITVTNNADNYDVSGAVTQGNNYENQSATLNLDAVQSTVINVTDNADNGTYVSGLAASGPAGISVNSLVTNVTVESKNSTTFGLRAQGNGTVTSEEGTSLSVVAITNSDKDVTGICALYYDANDSSGIYNLQGTTTVTATNNGSGKAYGVYGEAGANIDLADTTITATSKEGIATGIILRSGSEVSVSGVADIASTGGGYVTEGVFIDDSQITFEKDVYLDVENTSADGEAVGVRLQSTSSYDSTATFNGNVKIEADSSYSAYGINMVGSNDRYEFNGDKLEITVNAGSAVGIAAADGGSVTASDKTDVIVNVSTVSESGMAAGIFNAQFSSGAGEGNVVLNGNVSVKAEGDGAYAVLAYGGETTVGANEKKVVIEGDVRAIGGDIDVTLGTADSSLTGRVRTKAAVYATTNLNMVEGATWNVTGNSVVTNVEGSGTIKLDMASEDAVAIVNATSISQNTTVGATGAVTDYIAGLSDEAQTAAMESVVNAVTVDGTALTNTVTTDEGLIAGAYTITRSADENGKDVITSTQAANKTNTAIGESAVALKAHWRAHMNDMNKRMGELRNANGEHGVWTRMVRGEAEYEGVKAQYNQYQLGYDEKLSVDKRWTVGAAITFSEGDSSFYKGSTEDDSTAFAIYGSKLNNDGTYVDLIARYARLESDITTATDKSDYSTNGMSVSAEFGKRIQQGKGLWIEPQFELTYGSVDSAEYVLDGKKVQVGDMDSLIGRVGFSIGKDIEKGNVYARASYLYDFDGETEASFSANGLNDTIKDDLGGGWWEVGVGANINLSKATYIYADIEKTFGGEVDTNWQWNLGVRYSF